MFFSFNGHVFRQKEGLPIGSSISVILAILFMDKLETIALSSHLSISPYRRYVDDIYPQTPGEETADRFHHTMNSLHPKLKFEIEKPETTPSGFSLSTSLLDFKVTISKDGKNSFEFYKKPAKKPLFVHTNQPYPRNQRSTSFAMSGNVSSRCSTQMTSIKRQNMFDDILCLNGYPGDSIDQTKHPQSHQRNSRPPNMDWSYFKIPYISERLNHKMSNNFRKEGIPVRVAHRSYTFRRALSLATPRSVHVPGTTASPPTPNCAY